MILSAGKDPNLRIGHPGDDARPDLVVNPVPSSGGKPLEPFTRDMMEARFGTDFGAVRVHTGSAAEDSARALDAEAYAVGRDIVFGTGRYRPYAPGGRRLIAHELAHVVQQRTGGEEGPAPDSPDMEQAADRAMRPPHVGGGPVPAGGAARPGIALLPRSLRASVDPASLSYAEIEDEIFEIRRWLADHPENSADRQHLLGALREMEGAMAPLTAGEPAGREEFGAAFRREFASVLHVFGGTSGMAAETPIVIPLEGVESAPPDPLFDLFTSAQRDMLMDFIVTRRIPEGLFNGDEIGATGAQQRILLSAHILAVGTYRPGSFDQRVHARMCFHWAQIVHHYAGATPAEGPISTGVMGGFDLFGRAMIGSGRADNFQEPPVYAADLPDTETPGGVGPIPEGTGHARAEAAELERIEADPTARRIVHRRPAFPLERFGEIRPGDWLWYYNANASGGGSHSVIFSHWESDNVLTSKAGVPYMVAVCFSQGSPGAGGREHTARLSDRYSRSDRDSPGKDIYPITHITHVSSDSRPAVTLLDVLPDPGARRLRQMTEANQRFLRSMERRLRRPVNPGLLRQWLREQNLAGILSLADHLTERQQELLEEINSAEDLETLVRLNQWLHARETNAEILERNMGATFDAELEGRYAEEQARIDEERAESERQIAEIDAVLGPLRAALEAQETLRGTLDLAPEILRLQREVGGIWRRMQDLPRGPERDELRRRRRELLGKIEALRTQQTSRRTLLRSIRDDIRELRRRMTPLERRRRRITEGEAAEERALPYGFLHPGQLRGQITGRTTGRLADLEPQPPWALLTVPAGEEPR